MDRIEQIKKFLEASPADNFLQHALALEFIKQGKDADARQLFETILSRDAGYTGSYYHLAKLLERIGETAMAIEWYQKGMAATKRIDDNHAYNELRAAYEELVY